MKIKNEIRLKYFAKITHEGNSYLVRFRDFQNVFSEGDTIQEALQNASEALEGVLLTMVENGQGIPLPSTERENEHPIPVSFDVIEVLREQRKS